MINEVYLEKLLSLIRQGIISVEDIKNAEYKAEVERRLNPTTP
jgi:hypothetical protein